MDQSESALKGIRIVAFELAAAGPFCSEILADMGADVIKIERPGIGDAVREWDTAVRGLSSGYVWLNRNKRSLTVDVKQADGRQIIHRLAEKADVFLDNFAPGVADRLGLGYRELQSLNPRLVYCSISGYGQDGPYRDRKAFDLLIQGEAGLVSTTGYPDRPAKVGPPVADVTAGLYAALGIVMALYQRERTGRGQFVDISMFDSLLSWLGYFPHHYWHRGELPARVGMRHHYITPYGPFLAKDGKYVNLAVVSPSNWKVFCHKVVERPDLWANPDFKTAELRREHRAELEGIIEDIFLERDSTEWFERLESAELPYGEIRGIDEALAHPQAAARRMVRQVQSPVGDVPVVAGALRLSESPARYGRVPDLGEDTETILGELGYGQEEIDRLRTDRVV